MSETRKHLSDCVWAGQPLSAAMSCHCTATPPTPDLAEKRDAHGRTHASLEHTLHTYRKAWEQEKQRVAELEAEVERLRAKAAIVDAMERGEVWDLVVLELPSLDAPRRQYRITGKRGRFVGDTLAAAYAAATREGTGNG